MREAMLGPTLCWIEHMSDTSGSKVVGTTSGMVFAKRLRKNFVFQVHGLGTNAHQRLPSLTA